MRHLLTTFFILYSVIANANPDNTSISSSTNNNNTALIKTWVSSSNLRPSKEHFNIALITPQNATKDYLNNILANVDESKQFINKEKVELKYDIIKQAKHLAANYASLTSTDGLCFVNIESLSSQIEQGNYAEAVAASPEAQKIVNNSIKNNTINGEDFHKFIFLHEIGHCLATESDIAIYKTTQNSDLHKAFPYLSVDEIDNFNEIISSILLKSDNKTLEHDLNTEITRFIIYVNESYADAYASHIGNYTNKKELLSIMYLVREADSKWQAENFDHDTTKTIKALLVDNNQQQNILILPSNSILSFKDFILKSYNISQSKKYTDILKAINGSKLDNYNTIASTNP